MCHRFERSVVIRPLDTRQDVAESPTVVNVGRIARKKGVTVEVGRKHVQTLRSGERRAETLYAMVGLRKA